LENSFEDRNQKIREETTLKVYSKDKNTRKMEHSAKFRSIKGKMNIIRKF
jgi:hypothetical protein